MPLLRFGIRHHGVRRAGHLCYLAHPMQTPRYSPMDQLVIGVDHAVRTVFGHPRGTGRRHPAAGIPEGELSTVERDLAGRLMRVNLAGEVSAQALYQGQALVAGRPSLQARLEEAAAEENDHLIWCEDRLEALGAHGSRLNPFWYAGSFLIGAVAGMAGDRWNLGFLAETERQVVRHLDDHLARLPPADAATRAVLEQMRADEGRHATSASHAGAAELPAPLKRAMSAASRVMTGLSFWI